MRKRRTHEIDRLYLAAITSGDPEIALQAALQELDLVIADYLRVGRETGIMRGSSGFEVKFDFTKIAGGATIGSWLSPIASVIGGLTAGVSVERKVGGRSPKLISPYEYAARITKELL